MRRTCRIRRRSMRQQRISPARSSRGSATRSPAVQGKVRSGRRFMSNNMTRLLPVLLIASFAQAAEVKPVPPPGVSVPSDDRAALEAGLARLGRGIEKIRNHPLAPDVIIFHNAVRYALQYDEFF